MCEICSKAFTQRSALLFHTRYHLGLKPFVCIHCHRGFVSVSLMKRHVKLSHATKEKLQCADCMAEFDSRLSLRKHIRQVHFPNLYVCHACSRTFDSRSKYSKHMRDHSRLTAPCGDCDRILSSKSSLKRHSKVHQLEEPPARYIFSYHPLA